MGKLDFARPIGLGVVTGRFRQTACKPNVLPTTVSVYSYGKCCSGQSCGKNRANWRLWDLVIVFHCILCGDDCWWKGLKRGCGFSIWKFVIKKQFGKTVQPYINGTLRKNIQFWTFPYRSVSWKASSAIVVAEVQKKRYQNDENAWIVDKFIYIIQY